MGIFAVVLVTIFAIASGHPRDVLYTVDGKALKSDAVSVLNETLTVYMDFYMNHIDPSVEVWKECQKHMNQDRAIHLPNICDCRTYFTCTNAGPILKNCSGNLVFHPVKQVCTYKKDYHCPEPPQECYINPTTYSTTSTSTTTTATPTTSLTTAFTSTTTPSVWINSTREPTIIPPYVVCSYDGEIIPDMEDCHYFFECREDFGNKVVPGRKVILYTYNPTHGILHD